VPYFTFPPQIIHYLGVCKVFWGIGPSGLSFLASNSLLLFIEWAVFVGGRKKRKFISFFFLFPPFHYFCERIYLGGGKRFFLFFPLFFNSVSQRFWSASSFTLNKLECSKQANHFAIE